MTYRQVQKVISHTITPHLQAGQKQPRYAIARSITFPLLCLSFGSTVLLAGPQQQALEFRFFGRTEVKPTSLPHRVGGFLPRLCESRLKDCPK
jgi:hypothetical protein